jgi:hypothetical protein
VSQGNGPLGEQLFFGDGDEVKAAPGSSDDLRAVTVRHVR